MLLPALGSSTPSLRPDCAADAAVLAPYCCSDKNNTIPRPDLDLRTAPLNESERLMVCVWHSVFAGCSPAAVPAA